MNQLYKLIWNAQHQIWVAVAEITRGKGQAGSKTRRVRRSPGDAMSARALLLSTFALSAIGMASMASAQTISPTTVPQGGVVAQGQAQIRGAGSATAPVLNVDQSSQRAVVNWSSFNLGSAATVNFNQPNAQAATLNRVQDMNPSQILGRVNAPGQVTLINPAGVYFSPGAVLDVGALTATTMNQSDADFMAGNNRFSRNGSTGAVVNQGILIAKLGGYIALLAPEVRNEGLIVAQQGTVALAAGEAITLNFDPTSRLASLTVSPSQIQTLVANKTAIQATDGLVILSSRALSQLTASVVNSGSIDTSSLTAKGGRILLEGDDIQLQAGAKLNATGATGGGTVLVGGDWQGTGDMHQATRVLMEAGASIDASATHSGDGGKVVLWSDIHDANSSTTVRGNITARGGATGGNGGLVETSGHHVDTVGAFVNAGANQGTGGLWLIDPADAIITQAVADGYQSTLNTGTSVLNDVAGNMDWNSGVTLAKTAGGDATLTLRTASGHIALNGASISSSAGALNFVLWTNFNNEAGNGLISMNGGTTINTNGGHVWMGGGNTASSTWNGLTVGGSFAVNRLTNGRGISLTDTSITTGIGSIQLKGQSFVTSDAIGTNHTGIGMYGDTTLSTTSGAIDIQGQVAGTYRTGYGIELSTSENVLISSTSGAINITGTGTDQSGSGVGTRAGIRIYSGDVDSDVSVKSTSGDVTINGVGNFTSGNFSTSSSGLYLYSVSVYSTMQFLSQSGAINLLASNAQEATAWGNNALQIQQQSPNATNVIIGAGSGNILIQANSILQAKNLPNGIRIRTTGGLTIQPRDSSFVALRSGSSDLLTFSNFWDFGTTLSSFTLGKPGNTLALTLSNPLTVAGAISLYGGNLNINTDLTSTGAGDILLKGSETTTIGSGHAVTTANGNITVTGARFVNNSTAAALVAGGAGKAWQVWSSNANPFGGATPDVRGGLNYDFKQYAATYGSSSVQGTGNGFLYTMAPTVALALTGSTTKVYDGNTTASAAGIGFMATTGAVDGDVFGATSAAGFSFASKDAGTGIEVSTTGALVQIATSSTGKAVYGYGHTGGDAVTGNIGNIDKAELTLNGSQIYNGTTAFTGSNLTAIGVNGETFSLTGAGATGNLASKNVQSNQALANVNGLALGSSANGGLSGNYNVMSSTGSSVSVTPAALTVSSSNVTKTYDGTTTALGVAAVAVGTLYSGDTLSGGTFAFNNKNAGAGNKTVNVSGITVNDGNGGANYAVTVADNTTSTITPASITVSTNNISKAYDGTTSAAGAATVVTAGTLYSGDTLSGGTFAFSNKNAGAGNKTVTVGGVSVVDGNGGGNYNVIQASNTTSTITPVALTVTANSDAQFVSVADTAGYNGVKYTGFVAGETSSVLGAGLVINRLNAGTNVAPGVYAATLAPSGLAAGNYSYTYVNGDYTIIPAGQLLVKVNNTSATYGAAANYTVASAQYMDGTNVIRTLTNPVVTGNTYTYDDGAGGHATFTIAPTGAVNSTSGNLVVGNYALTATNVTETSANFSSNLMLVGSMTVAQKGLGVSAGGVSKVYDGTTSMNAASVNVTGAVVGDGVTASGSNAAYTSKNAGTNLGYSISNLTLAGADAGNYFFSGGSSYLGTDGVITRAALTVSANNITKTYDGTTSAAGAATVITAGTLYAGDTLSGGSFAFSDKNAGTGNKTVNVSGVTVADGNAGGNYTLTQAANTTSTIDRAALTVSTSNVTKTYDGTTGAAGVATVTGGTLFSGDTLTGGSFAFADKNAATGNKTVNVSGINVADGNAGGNYIVTQANNTTSTINRAALTVSTSNVTKTYDSTTGAVGVATVTGGTLFSGDTLNGGTFAFTNKNAGAGNKTVTVGGITVADGNAGGNYIVTQANNTTSTINRAALTVSTGDVTKTYDGTTSATGANGATALVIGGTLYAGDTLSGGSFAYTDKNASTGDKIVTVGGVSVVDGNGGGNYTLTLADNHTSTITPAALTVSTSDVTKVYDGNTNAVGVATVKAGTLFAGDTLSGGSFAFANKSGGTGKTVNVSGISVIDGHAGGNYLLTFADNTTSTITPAPLTVTANNDARFVTLTDVAGYNGASYSGFVAGETSGVLGGTLVVNRPNSATDVAANVYTGALVASGLSSTDYNFTYANGNYTVVPAGELLVKVSNTNATYGSAAGYTVSSAEYMDGNFVIHTLTNSTVNGNTYTFNDGSSGIAIFTIGAIGAVNSPAGKLAVGNYALTASDITETSPNFSNHLVVVGNLAVEQKGVTAVAGGTSKVYDGNTSMTGVNVNLNGRETGDSVTVSGTGEFASKNAGSNLGYSISNMTLGGTDFGNYYLIGGGTLSGSDGVITPAALTVSASDISKVYDGTTGATGVVVLTGGTLYGSDALSGGSFAFSDKNAGTGKTVTVDGVSVADGNGGGNYAITLADNTNGSITPALLTVSTGNVVKTYDGTTGAAGVAAVTAGTLYAGDTLTGGSFAFTDKNVGAGNKTVNVSGITVTDGNGGGNYTVTQTNNTTSTITPKLLLVNGTTAQSRPYDGTDVATLSGAALESGGVVAGDVVDLANGTVGRFNNGSAGNGKSVTTAMTLTGSDSGNYSVVQPIGLTADILGSSATTNSPTQALNVGNLVPPGMGSTLTSSSSSSSSSSSPPSSSTSSSSSLSSSVSSPSSLSSALSSNPSLILSLNASGTESSAAVQETRGESAAQWSNLFTVDSLRNATQVLPGLVLVQVNTRLLGDQALEISLPEQIHQTLREFDTLAEASLPDGKALPGWLRFDAQSLKFVIQNLPDNGLPLTVLVRVGTYRINVELVKMR